MKWTKMSDSAATVGYETQLWQMADALRGSMDANGNGNGGKAKADISIYGQESNYTTWRLAKMNLALRGIDGQIKHGDSFQNDKHPDLKADFILANPPFNISDWGGERLREDKRWQYGVPPAGNANFAGCSTSSTTSRPRVWPVSCSPHRGRSRGLHGGAARTALLLDPDPGLPLVSRARP